MIALEKAMTLLYMQQDVDEKLFSAERLLHAQDVSLREHYIPMTQLPLAEMRFEQNPVQLVEEVIAMTAGVNWRRQGRRPLRRGDIVCRGKDPWVVLKLSDTKGLVQGRNAVIPLHLWPNYGIHFLNSVTSELQELM